MLFFRWLKKIFGKVFGFIGQAWFLYLLLFIALCLIVWFVGDLITMTHPAAVRLTIILILVLAWALNQIRLILKKQRQNQSDEDEEQVPYTPEDLNVLRTVLENQYSAAVKRLPKRRWWRFEKVEDLPWLLNIGLPKSGKTAAAQASSLSFPDDLNDSETNEYCNFRFSTQAVVIDTDGMLTAHGQKPSLHKAAWYELINLMRQYRFRKTIDGVILSVDITELAKQTPQQRAAHALALRNRLYDLGMYLGYQCPVYVQITHADCIVGFNEFADSLTEQERQQILGFNLPTHQDEDGIRYFAAYFDQLIDRLQQFNLTHLNHEKNTQKMAAALLFPNELQSLKKDLQDFLVQIFESNQYQEKAFIRGVYFISTTFAGKPQNFLMDSYNKQFGLKAKIPAYLINSKAANFITDLYQNLILKDKNIYRYTRGQGRYLIFRNSFVSLLLILLIGMMTHLWIKSYQLNATQLTALNTAGKAYIQLVENKVPDEQDELFMLYRINHAFNPTTDLNKMHWGLYQGNRAKSHINDFYLRELKKRFLPELVLTVQTELQDNLNSPSETYNFLRAYLMLGDPQHLSKSFMEDLMRSYWLNTYPTQTETREILNNSLADYLDYHETKIPLDKHLIAQARNVLKDIPPSEQVFFQLERDALGQNYQISNSFDQNFNQVFQTADNNQISALFSKPGYKDMYLKDMNSLVDNIQDSNWILGQQHLQPLTADERSSIKSRVATLYMRHYTQSWNGLLDNFKIKPFSNLDQAGNTLQILAQSGSPIEDILTAVKDNTELEPGDALLASTTQSTPAASSKDKKPKVNSQKLAGKAMRGKSGIKSMFRPRTVVKNASKMQGMFGGSGAQQTTPVGKAFAGLNAFMMGSSDGDDSKMPYQNIIDTFGKLSAYVGNITSAPNPNKAAYDAVIKHMKAADGDDPLNDLIKLANQSPEPMRRWLNSIAINTWQSMLNASGSYINDVWEQDVYPQYQHITQQYPFSRHSQSELNYSELSGFLAKGGTLEQFFTTYLAPFVNVQTKPWSLQPILKSTLPIDPKVLSQIYRWQILSQAMYPNGDSNLDINATIDTLDLSDNAFMAELQIGGTSITSRHAPSRPLLVSWPGKNPQPAAALILNTINGNKSQILTNGNWAWFHLLDKASSMYARNGDGSLVVRFNVGNSRVSYVINTQLPVDPFDLRTLRSLQLPQTLESNTESE
tara:strand:- start:88827 stop:92420 length:3594 start_codon:yes stop_codon:yes gene_type:complete